jgi:hypothetical protein
LIDLAYYISSKFPELTFNVSSDFSRNPNCAEEEKYTSLFRNGILIRQLTRQEWIENYLGMNICTGGAYAPAPVSPTSLPVKQPRRVNKQG